MPDFPRPAAKIAGERCISGSRFPGRAVGLCFGVTACPCEVTGDSPYDKDPACPWPAAPGEGPRAKIHGRNTARGGNNASAAGKALGCPRPRGAGWEPVPSTTPAAAPRPGVFSGAGASSKLPCWAAGAAGSRLSRLHPARRSGAAGWLRGPVSHRRYLPSVGRSLPVCLGRRQRISAFPPSHCNAFSRRREIAWRNHL